VFADLFLVDGYPRRKLEGARVFLSRRMAAHGVAVRCGRAIAWFPSPDVLLRVLMLHVTRGYSLRETVVHRVCHSRVLLKTSYIPWVSDICGWKKKNPQVSNIYMEMGSAFAMMVSSSPLLAA
jgi:hypothetical protein